MVVIKKIMQQLFCGLLACTPAAAVVQYCIDNTSQGAEFCVSMVAFQTNPTHGVDLYLTIELLDRPGRGWIAFGIGDSMAESLMFIVLTDETGETVVTTRTTKGHFMPEHDSKLLPLGKLISYQSVREGWRQISVLCSSCDMWENFQVDSESQPWVWSRNGYQQVEHADHEFHLQMHDSLGFFYVNMTAATANPGQPAAPPALAASKGSYGAALSPLRNELTHQQPSRLVRDWHGPLLGTSFMILFPAGAIIARWKQSHWFWIHIIWQLLTALACVIGVMMQVTYLGRDGFWQRTNISHILLGVLLAVSVLLQIIFGYWHHVLFARSSRTTRLTRLHIWNGRLMLAAGILNTGLGLKYANQSNTVIYAWGIFAAVEEIFLLLVLPCIERRVSVPKADPSVSKQNKVEVDEAAAYLLESIYADSNF